MRAKHLPGAGQYNTYRAVGKQPLSNKKTLPAHSFGKSTRDASKKSEFPDPLAAVVKGHGPLPPGGRRLLG